MAFWNRKHQEPVVQVKAVPDLGIAMAVAGYAPANWMAATPEAFARDGYMRNAVAYACVQKIASGVASVDIDVAKYVGNEKVELEEHPLYELIERPNPRQSGAELFRAITSHKKISGNAYILKLPLGSTEPTELWALRPDRIRIINNSRGETSAYEYKTGTNAVIFPVADDGSCDVLHFKEFHPLDDFYGLAPMQSASNNVDIVNEANAWNMSLLQNGARPCGAFVMKSANGEVAELSDEQFIRLREQVAKDVGATAAGKPLILEGGLDWKEMSLSPKDMDFGQNMWASARMIATAFGVPPQLVNIPGESTYSNLTEAKLSLWQETILPELDYLLDELNNWLTPLYGDNVYVCYDTNEIAALEHSRFDKLTKIESLNYLTIDEKRRLAGFADYEQGTTAASILYADSNKVPLDILSDGQQEEI